MNRQAGLGAIIVFGVILSWGAPLIPDAYASSATRTLDAGRLALKYAEAFAASRMTEWAQLDLGCRARQRQTTGRGGWEIPTELVQRCWDDTLKAHRELAADEPEPGIFGAVGRGQGFGLISEKHRQADTWKEYPPAVFLSPSVVTGALPKVTVKKVWRAQPIALQVKGQDPFAARGTMVEVIVSYPDPLNGPLALRPDEVWWANGQIRRYGPVREVAIRFVVATGLRQHAYPVDAAVINEALADAPQIPGTRYGRDPDNIGRAFEHLGDAGSGPPVRGGLVLGSARWWNKQDAGERFHAELTRAKYLSNHQERLALLRRLWLLDPNDAETNALLGAELYQAFLNEGVRKSGINAPIEAVKYRLAELYWNIQAQTWRQELTAVSTGYEPAADLLYGAIASLETAVRHGWGDPESRRRLGALARWNGDAEAALAVHEQLLHEVPDRDRAQRGSLLSELAWDRLQWLTWNRRYEHPWMDQTKQEAEQALELVEDPLDKVVAAQALLMQEALSPRRTPAALSTRVRMVKEWLDRLPGVIGIWNYLIGNDVVKALIPEGMQVMLSTPVRSLEVLDVSVHSTPPAQDLLRSWDFDNEAPGSTPRGLLAVGLAPGQGENWTVVADPQAPTAPHALMHRASCPAPDCVHLLLTEEQTFEYVDITVHLRFADGPKGRAGIAVGGRDGGVIYAATVNPEGHDVAIHRIEHGQATLLGRATVKLGPGQWHLLRIQRENFAHVSQPRLSLFFDGSEVLAVSNEPIQHAGRVGLITMGNVEALFDGFHILKLVSNEPLSPAAAY